MIFNSLSFLLFFIIIFFLCAWIGFSGKIDVKQKVQYRNIILLIASYYFYAFLKWEFLLLLLFTTLVNYVAGYQLGKSESNMRKKRCWLWMAVLLSVGVLAYFKYANFFIDSVNQAFSLIGIEPKMQLMKIILPVGISFFTFQALSYTLDVYHGKIHARRSFIDVALFVSFFPTILSGPIEKARNLLPQLESPSVISANAVLEGGKRFLWGLFKKIVIADRLGEFVDTIYSRSDLSVFSSQTLIIAAVFYSVQIYADFSGYSDMAIGIAKALGFQLKENFNYPYFSTSIKTFWKRWHISLTSWFSEYLYIPLGGNRVSRFRWMFNISAVFLVSGLWHGANWAFIVWGALHAIYYLIEFFLNKRNHKVILPDWLNVILKGLSCFFVFALVTIAWIFFRMEDSAKACLMIENMFTSSVSGVYLGASSFETALTGLLLVVFIIMDWIRFREYKVSWVGSAVFYAVILCMILLFGVSSGGFVYFQF